MTTKDPKGLYDRASTSPLSGSATAPLPRLKGIGPSAPPPLPAPTARRATAPIPPLRRAPASGGPAPKSLSRPPSRPPHQPPPATEPTPSNRFPAARCRDWSGAERINTLLQACNLELRLAEDDDRRAAMHFELGELHDHLVGDELGALEHYRATLKLDPQHIGAIRAARRIAIVHRDREFTLTLYDAEIAVASDRKLLATLYVDKGLVLSVDLPDPEGAKACWIRANALDPNNPVLLRLLEQVHTEGGEWGALIDTYEGLANAATADAPLRAALIALRARKIEAHLGEARRAADLYAEALELDPNAIGALAALKRLLHSEGRWRDLTAVLEREAAQCTDPENKAIVLFQAGRIWAEHLGDPGKAIEAVTRAAQSTPKDALVLAELARLHEIRGDAQGLTATLERLIETMDQTDRLATLHRLGTLYDEQLRNPVAARRAFEAALAISPTFVPALRGLGRLLAKASDWEALAAMHAAEAEANADTKRRATAHLRIAELMEGPIGRVEKAVEHFEIALGLNPALHTAFKALVRLYAAAGRYRELVELHERAIDRASDDDLATTWLMKIGSLHEDALGEPRHAARAYQRVLSIQPRHLAAVHSLQRAAEAAGMHKEHARALELEVEQIEDRVRIADLLHRSGEIHDERLGEPDAAKARYRRVLEIDANHRPTLAGLGRLFHKLERWRDLLEIYAHELRVADEQERVSLLHKMGELSELRLGEPDRAISFYRQAIDLDGRHGPALHSLQILLRHQKAWGPLAEVLETELRGLDEAPSRARVACQLAELRAARLAQPAAAAAAFREALEAMPRYRPALSGLARVTAQLEDWSPLAELHSREGAEGADARLRVEALHRAAEIWEDNLTEPARAVASRRALLAQRPNAVPGLLGLERALRSSQDTEGLLEVLATQATTFDDGRAIKGALDARVRLLKAQAGSDPRALRDDLVTMAGIDPLDRRVHNALEALARSTEDLDLLIFVRRLHSRSAEPAQSARAALALAEVLSLVDPADSLVAARASLSSGAPSRRALLQLEVLSERLGSVEGVAEAQRGASEWHHHGPSAAKLLVKAAEAQIAAGLHDAAASDLERALERDADNEPAARRLASLLTETRQIDRLIDGLSAAAEGATEDHRRVALWMGVARLQADHKGNVQAAISALGRLLRRAPDLEAYALLADCHLRLTHWTEAKETLGRLLAGQPEPSQRAKALAQLARLGLDHLDTPRRALDHAKQLLVLEPDHPEGLRCLAEASAQLGDQPAARAACAELARSSQSAEAREAACMLLGTLERAAGESSAASLAFARAAVFGGPDGIGAAAFRSLAETQTALDWTPLVSALREFQSDARARRVSDPDPARTTLAIARLLTERLDQRAQALALLKSSVNEDPDGRVRTQLAASLEAADRHEDAATVLEGLLRERPSNTMAWLALTRCLAVAGDTAGAAFTAQALPALGEAAPVVAGGHRFGGIHARLDSQTVEQLIGGTPGGQVAQHLLAAVHEGIAKAYPDSLPTERERLTERSAHPVWALAEGIGRCLGAPKFDVYLVPDSEAPRIAMAPVPTLLLPRWVAELPPAEQAFTVARPLVVLARGQQAGTHLSAEALDQLTKAAFDAQGAGRFDTVWGKIYKALPRRTRRSVEQLIQELGRLPAVDMARWQATIPIGANRIAALIAGTPSAAAQVMARLERQGHRHGNTQADVAGLLRFWSTAAARKAMPPRPRARKTA